MDIPDPESPRKGLPGLRVIREALRYTQSSLGKSCGSKGRTEVFIRHLESGFRDCSQSVQREIAEVLCCTVADLHGHPSDARIAKIKATHSERVAAQDRANADAMAKGVA